MAGESYYITRGATMRCDKGSAPRKINLMQSHGSYANGKPMMNKMDNVPNVNISSFGSCAMKKGDPCVYASFGKWQNAKEDTLVEGKPALTTESYLVCTCGGIIKFITNGQL